MRKIAYYIIFLICIALQSKAQKVQPFSLPEKIPADWEAFGDRTYISIQKQAHYLLSKVHEFDNHKTLKLLSGSGSLEYEVRPNTGGVAGFAFLYKFGNYNPSITGVSRPVLLQDYIIPMMRYLCRTHLTGDLNTSDGKKWGDQWQSAHWANALAKGAWWIWDDLPDDVKKGVLNVVKFEARRFYKMEPPFNIQIDTKSEENAWNSQIFHSAMLLMPNDNEYLQWENLLRKWVISSYVRPVDLINKPILDGKPMPSFTGANIYDDYTLENHYIVHPDYMNAFILTSQFALDYAMQGKAIPEFVFFNNKGIYENIKWFTLPDGGMNYPSGQDWPIYRNPDWLFTHVHTVAFKNDNDATELARRALNTLEKMQNRNTEGNVYQPEENFFPPGNTDLIYYTAISWLSLHYINKKQDDFSEKKGVKILEAGKIVLNRSAKAIQSLSWGRAIMFQCVANSYDRVFDSSTENGRGYIILKDESKPLAVSLSGDIKLNSTKKSFTAEFTINHGGKVAAQYIIKSHKNKMRVFEKLVALDDITTKTIATSFYGVLNNKNWVYETGVRDIKLDNNKTLSFIAGKNEAKEIPSKKIVISNSVSITSKKVLNAKYEQAKEFYRSRLTDKLILNYLPLEKRFTKGSVLTQTEYEITVL